MHGKPSLQLKNKYTQAQGIVEFAIVIPVVLTIVFGIIEIGFLLFTYSSVNSAAREAARYGIAIGEVGADQRYYDCDGIEEAGLRIGRFAGMTASDISISYDHGPKADGSAPDEAYPSCTALEAANGAGITFGDRIVVDVNHQYKPLVAYMGLKIAPFTMSASSARTIFKGAEIIAGGGDGAGGGGGGGGGGGCELLTINVVGGNGNPAASPASSTGCDPDYYTAGEAITIAANPASGYQTYSWSGVDSSSGDTASLTFPGATTVGVTYVSDTCFTLGTVSFDGPGSQPGQSSSGVCALGYAAGETITFTGNPDPGNGVGSWDGANKVNATTATLTMPAINGTNIIAHYVPCYTVSAASVSNPSWGGTPNVVTISDTCTSGYAEGETITLQAYPSPDYQVASWSGVDSFSGSQATLTVPSGGAAVTVSYELKPTLSPPVGLNVPNNFPQDFTWNNTAQTCSDFTFNYSPAPDWPRTPDYYNVYIIVQTASGNVTSVYQTTSVQFISNATVTLGRTISFGVEGVFLNNPTATSMYSEQTYKCFTKDLAYVGSLTRGQ